MESGGLAQIERHLKRSDMSTDQWEKKVEPGRLTSMWAEVLPGTTCDPKPLLQSIVCRDHMRKVDGVNHALAAIGYVTDTTLKGGFEILGVISTCHPTASSPTYGSSRFIFWYSGISLTPGQSFSGRYDGLSSSFPSDTIGFFTVGRAKNFENFKELIPLKRYILLRV